MGVIERLKKSETTTGLNMDFFMNGDPVLPVSEGSYLASSFQSPSAESKPKKKRGRPKKKTMPDGNEIITGEDEEDHSNYDLPMTQSNVPYNTMYDETSNMLRTSIFQIDSLNNDIKNQIDSIKDSKTIKRKYDYMSTLSTTASALLSTKISAIREMNKSITDSNNLELKRSKEMKLSEAANGQDDNKLIMEMYNKFISNPTMGYSVPTSTDITLMTGIENMVRSDIGNMDYAGLSSSENMMRLENNPNIKTVVICDLDTGARWFDVIDITTQQSVPNVEKPDAMFLDNLTLDFRNGIARDTNLDISYPLISANGNKYEEY